MCSWWWEDVSCYSCHRTASLVSMWDSQRVVPLSVGLSCASSWFYLAVCAASQSSRESRLTCAFRSEAHFCDELGSIPPVCQKIHALFLRGFLRETGWSCWSHVMLTSAQLLQIKHMSLCKYRKTGALWLWLGTSSLCPRVCLTL